MEGNKLISIKKNCRLALICTSSLFQLILSKDKRFAATNNEAGAELTRVITNQNARDVGYYGKNH